MAKDTFYFSHDYNTRTDIKIKKLIQKHGYVGYGIFWAIVEDLYNNANALPADYESIAYDLREDEKLIISVINDFDLFIIDNNIISSESVERRLILRDAKTDAARAAALARWEKEREKKRLKDANASNNNANALQTKCNGNAIKENKENDIKLNETIEDKNKINNPSNQNTNNNIDPDLQKRIETFEKICQKFLEEDLQNFVDYFKTVDIREKNIKEALKDYKDDKIIGDVKQIPFKYSYFKEWFKKYLTDNREKYKHIPKFRVTYIDEKVERLDLHAAFDFYWQPEYTIEFIRDKIYSGEFKPKNNLNFKKLIDDNLITTEND